MSTEPEQRAGRWVPFPTMDDLHAKRARWNAISGMWEVPCIPAPDARDAEIAELKLRLAEDHRLVRLRVEQANALESEIATLKSQLADANEIREQQSASIGRLTSSLAEATKPVSVPGRPSSIGQEWTIDSGMDKKLCDLAESERLYALALEARVRELENPKHPPDATPERQGKIPVWFSYDDVGDTGILYVNIGAKIIALKEFGPFRSLKSVLSGEPARADAVAKIKGGAQ